MKSAPCRLLLLAGVVLLASAVDAATGINLDFGTTHGVPSSSYGAASGQTGTWNMVGSGATPLIDVNGGPSPASVTVTNAAPTGHIVNPSGDDQLLMFDNFLAGGSPSSWGVDLTGLVPGDYVLFLYAPSHPAVATGLMRLDGESVANLPGEGAAMLIEGVSWTAIVVTVTTGDLSLTASNPGAAGLAGLQLVPVAVGVNVDFGVSYGVPAASYGAASGQAGDWNLAGLGVTALVDVWGTASGVTVTVASGSDTGNAGTPASDDELLLKDNFFSSADASWSVDLDGLAPGDYTVFLYAPAHGSVVSGDMTVQGVAVSGIPGDPLSTLVHGASWTSVTIGVTDGTLAISSPGSGFSGLAGLQVVPVTPALNVDLGTTYGVPAASYGAAAGQPGSWHLGHSGRNVLFDANGEITGVTLDVDAADTGSTSLPSGDDELLLHDNLLRSGASWSADLSGLPSGNYVVFLYAPSHSAVPTGDMTVGGLFVPGIPGDVGSALIEGTSWVSVHVSVTDGSLPITGGGLGLSGLAGMQVVPLPEPGALGLGAGVLSLALLARRRRRMS